MTRLAALLLCLLAWSLPAQAATIPALHEVFTSFETVSQQITDNINTALGTSQVERVVNVLFVALGSILFIWRFAGFALRGFDMLDLLTLTMTFVLVYILLTGYKAIFPPVFDAGRYVSDVLGNGITGRPLGTSMAESIFNMIIQVKFEVSCSGWDCIGASIIAFPATVTAYLMVLVLGVIATLVELWTIWGFQIAYAVGWVTIPFLLFERLAFLFDGWLKFLFGLVVYVIVAKINLALVLLGMEILFNVEGSTGPGSIDPVQITGFFDVVGMYVFMGIGVATLYSTGKFASSIVNSAAGGGVGEMVQKTAQAAAKLAGQVAAL